MALGAGLATVQPVRVGVQAVSLWPWNDVTGPYDTTTEEKIWGLRELNMTKASKSAEAKGGETVHIIGSFETDRETKVKVSNCKASLRVLSILLGGTFLVNPPATGVKEQQYYAEGLSERAPYFRLRAIGLNGDGQLGLMFPKLRVSGNIGFHLQKDQVTELEFEGNVVFDYTYVRVDGSVGAASELFYDDDVTLALPF